MLLSDDDFEDQNDDDLFQEFVDHSIDDTVGKSLRQLSVKGRGSDNEDVEVNGGGLEVPNDVDLNDCDDEVVSVIGLDDEGPQYPEFNPDTNFKGKVVLTKGLKFGDNNIFRKALQWNAIELGYNYCFLHNNNTRVYVYCANSFKCPLKRGRLLRCTCKIKRKCKFKVHCMKLKNEQTWQIKSKRPDHICGHQSNNPKCTS